MGFVVGVVTYYFGATISYKYLLGDSNNMEHSRCPKCNESRFHILIAGKNVVIACFRATECGFNFTAELPEYSPMSGIKH